MNDCECCDKPGAAFDCNGLKFCNWNCLVKWDAGDSENFEEMENGQILRRSSRL